MTTTSNSFRASQTGSVLMTHRQGSAQFGRQTLYRKVRVLSGPQGPHPGPNETRSGNFHASWTEGIIHKCFDEPVRKLVILTICSFDLFGSAFCPQFQMNLFIIGADYKECKLRNEYLAQVLLGPLHSWMVQRLFQYLHRPRVPPINLCEEPEPGCTRCMPGIASPFLFLSSPSVSRFLPFISSLHDGVKDPTILIQSELICTIIMDFLCVAFLWDLSMHTVLLLSAGHLKLESHIASP